jgi:CO/xanthine dehydrogenase FAD-binding subunit
MMIKEYFRPQSIDEAVKLLTNSGKSLSPLGGGTQISRHQSEFDGVVDLQAVGMDKITAEGQYLQVGAMVRLQSLLDHDAVHPEIQRAVRIDASQNIRNMASLGGWLVSSDARSITTTALLALDAALTWEPGKKQIQIGDWLLLRASDPPGSLMTTVEWRKRLYLTFEYVARSPKDKPVVIVAAAQWGSGRTRVALGGYGKAPILAMDGPERQGADVAARDAFADAEDKWATADYRRTVAGKLALRCLERIDAIKESEV